MALRTIRARYAGGVLEPLEALDLEDGAEVSVAIEEKLPADEAEAAFWRSAGSWKGNHDDPDELIRMLYESRIRGSREPPDL